MRTFLVISIYLIFSKFLYPYFFSSFSRFYVETVFLIILYFVFYFKKD